MVVAHPDVVYKDADIQTTDFFNELQDLLKTIEDFEGLKIWQTLRCTLKKTWNLDFLKILPSLMRGM